MDEQRLERACELVALEKYSEAYDAFTQLAEDTANPIERAWPLLYAANTLQTLGQEEAATAQVNAVRELLERHRSPSSASDENFIAAEAFLGFSEGHLLWRRGGNEEAALSRFDAVLKKHGRALKDPRAQGLYEGIQIRRAFILANLGRWNEAMPILESIESPKEYEEGIAFYLGHCYLAAYDYNRAEEKLTEALSLGLPSGLGFRAHCELGMASYNLRKYSKAKRELEKGARLADDRYINHIWKWLEFTCKALGLKSEAEHYARMQNPS
jgi:tetratricopeptide (TPR) repeat protein